MQKGGKIVYTSLEDFTSSKVSVRKYTELPDSFCEWIENTTEKLLVSRSVAELRAAGVTVMQGVNMTLVFLIC